MKKRVTTSLLILATATLFFTGCGKKNEEIVDTEEPVVLVTEEVTEESEPEREKGRNLLTGEPIKEEIACLKPVSAMIGNTNDDAMPQCGIGQADIIYEAPVEGGLTRLMAIFQDHSGIEKLGSVRSCRYYFAYFSAEFQALYLHYGQAYSAEELLASGSIEDLNGLDGKVDSLAFYRDKERKQPHNAFTTAEGLDKAIEYKEYDVNYTENYLGHYQFAEDDKPVTYEDGEDAKVVCPGYPINKPWLVYNEDDGLYYRYQYKKEHIDGNTEEQLTFKNVIFQYMKIERDGTSGGYLNADVVGEGEGKFITNGKAIDITWKKESTDVITRYYDKKGDEIVLNQGKTNVCVIANSSVSRVGIYDSEEAYEEAKAAN